MILVQINDPIYDKNLMEIYSQKINNFNNIMNYLMGNNMLQNNISHFIPKDSLNKTKKINFSREKLILSYELDDIGNSPKQNLIFKAVNGFVVNVNCPINTKICDVLIN